MISFNEIKSKCVRENDLTNRILHFFSSQFSLYFSYIFINLKMSANQVTVLFFITGLIGSLLFLSSDFFYLVLGYILWRLHVIFDICDGDVARFSKKYSVNGAYWDYMIHSVLYPLSYSCIMFSLYIRFDFFFFIYFAIFGSIIVSQMLTVKNNYYRAMLFNDIPREKKKYSLNNNPVNLFIKNLFFSLIGYEGFLFFYVVLSLLDTSYIAFMILAIFYTLMITILVFAKFWLFTKFGFYRGRS